MEYLEYIFGETLDEDVVLAMKPTKMLRTIETMLNSGEWVLIMGDIRCMQLLEYKVYPPGTEENKNFILIMASSRILTMAPGTNIPLSIPIPIGLAKKTDKLKKMLKMPEEDFKTLLALELVFQPKSSDSPPKCGFDALMYRKGMRKKLVKNLIAKLKEKVILV